MKRKVFSVIAASTLSITQLMAQSWGFDIRNTDQKCAPCNDFYQFANGTWMAKNPIPSEYPRWGMFSKLQVTNEEALKNILEQTSKSKIVAGSNDQKLADFYYTAMDTIKLEKDGYIPLATELKRISLVQNLQAVNDYIAHLHTFGIYTPFVFYAAADAKNSSMVVANINQGGLSLPDKDYYIKKDARSEAIKQAFKQYIQKTFELIGEDNVTAKKNAGIVYDLEYKLAEISKNSIELRDPEANYHKMSVADVQKLTPHFNWNTYLTIMGAKTATKEIVVGQPEFLQGLDKLLSSTSIEDLKVMLRWAIVSSSAPYLSKAFVENDFDFNNRTLKGTPKMQPRWKTAVAATDKCLGDALGQAYVAKYFPPTAKAKMQEMIKNLKDALKTDIGGLTWMSDSTKKRALEKLNSFEDKIGYPTKWKDYTTLKIDRSSYLTNIWNASVYETKLNIAKIGKPVDRTEWGMTAPTVNAYYNPVQNEIVFPAGILQSPFFNANADDAINYGGIGGVIGHEMTHGFDDQGSQFDAKGNLNNWFTEQDLKNFKGKSQCIVDQFNNLTAIDTLKFKGELVVGESIADLGGLMLAYTAYRNSLKGKPEPLIIDGFTPDQRFFLGWAQVWASNQRDEFSRLMVNTNPHPLPKERVNAPLSNLEIFQKAFGCKQGDKMVRSASEKCEIW